MEGAEAADADFGQDTDERLTGVIEKLESFATEKGAKKLGKDTKSTALEEARQLHRKIFSRQSLPATA